MNYFEQYFIIKPLFTLGILGTWHWNSNWYNTEHNYMASYNYKQADSIIVDMQLHMLCFIRFCTRRIVGILVIFRQPFMTEFLWIFYSYFYLIDVFVYLVERIGFTWRPWRWEKYTCGWVSYWETLTNLEWNADVDLKIMMLCIAYSWTAWSIKSTMCRAVAMIIPHGTCNADEC